MAATKVRYRIAKEGSSTKSMKVSAWNCFGEKTGGICVDVPHADNEVFREIYITDKQLKTMGFKRIK